jgi:hypothetical protein
MEHVILSDALNTAVAAIDSATADPFTARCYTDPGLAKQIAAVREAIDNLRNAIDSSATADGCERLARSAIISGAV